MASLPRPLSKKHSSNGFSSKNVYDGVFDGPPKFGAPPPTFSSRIEDYAEIFGASRASSIPILDLSTLDGGNDSSAHDRRSKLDYSKIFGGLRDEYIAASYEEFFSKGNGAQSSPANTRIRSPDIASGALNHQAGGVFLSEASKPEGRKQFNMSFHKTGRRDNTWENGTTHVAELHAVPGFTCFFDGNHPVLTREGDKLERTPIEEVKCPPKEVDIRFSNNKASVETGKSKSEFSGKESSVIGNSSNATENNLKTCPSDMLSSSSIPVDKAGYKRATKRTMDPYFKGPDIDTLKAGGDGCSTSSSDEDLDINSVAGASAAALKRALVNAEASIKVAREMMERKKDGSRKVSRRNSKTSSDVKKSRKDKVADQSSGARKNNVKESSESSSVFLQVFSKLDREKARKRGKVSPDFKEMEFISKRVGETNVNNLGSPKDREGPQQMSETRNIVEWTTATLASDREGSPDNIVIISVESRASSRKETEAAKGTLDRVGVHVKELDEEAPEEHGFVADTAEEFHSQPECEYVETLKEDLESEDIKSSTREEECMKKFEEFLSEIAEDNESEMQTAMEHDSEKCYDETHDCMENEIKREDAYEEQNEKIFLREEGEGQSKLRLICELEATRATALCRENVCEAESDKQIHYDSDKVEGNQKEVDNINELDIVSKILDGPPDEAESDERYEGDDDWEGLEKVVTDDHAHIEADSRCIEKPEVNLDGVRETTNSNAGSCDASKDPNESQEGLSPTRNEGHLSSEENESLSDATHSCETSDGEMGLETDEMTHVLSKENECTTGGLLGTAVPEIKNENGLEEAVEAGFTDTTFRTKETKQNDKESEFASTIGNGIETTVCELGEDEKEFGESGVAYDLRKGRNCFDAAQEQKERVQSGKKTEASQPSCSFDVEEKIIGAGEESKSHIAAKDEGKCGQTFTFEEKKTNDVAQKELKAEKEQLTKDDEASNRYREREKERMAVDRAIREARERAFAEARERAERAAVERATAEARQRVMAEAREKFEKTYAANKLSTEKATAEAKLRAERAAVERATTEARNRALEKALSQKATTGAREQQTDRSASEKNASTSRDSGMRQNNSSSDAQLFEGLNGESAQRRKARLERHQRTMERAAKALAEKNMRDLLAQKEQAQRNRMADILDADVRRWANGKEGNLRALLSTLQYILGPDSGWQPISLTEIIQTAAVKKAYRKATLHVHPDKLQQRGATIQQKYICEKVFDLLKAAWNRFNSEER